MSNVDISPIPRLAQQATYHPDRLAIIYEAQRITFAELHEEVGRFAAALVADGIGKGDRIGYLGLNSANFAITYLAAAWVGAAFVPFNFRLAGEEIRALVEDSRPDVLIVEPAHAQILDEFIAELAVRQPLIVDNDPALEPAALSASEWKSLTGFVATDAERLSPVARHQNDLAVLMYTSGTTGRPKGVMLTHGNIWWNQLNVDSVVDTRIGDVNLVVAPLFHIGAFNSFTLRCFTRGATSIIRRTFDPEATLRDLVEYRVNNMFAVPAMMIAVSRVPGFETVDLSELRSSFVAGAPAPPALIEKYVQRGVSLGQAWGLTETCPFATYLGPSHIDEKIGSAGIPMPYTEVQVADLETGKPIETPGVPGELQVRGPNVVSGYWNNDAATAAAFTSDGWFRSGDIGYRDDEGYYFIIDRLKDMVITGGENVYPAEVERVLAAHPEITDVAVVGTADEKWGEAVTAVVTVTADASLDLEDVRTFAAEHIARYKLPTRLTIVDVLPRNGAGKLDKIAIRTLASEEFSVAAR